jgi:hypothetical protein
MKRCPQCEFIYPDRDDQCDFDQTPLVSVTESEIAAITNTPERPVLADLAATYSRKFKIRRNRRTLPIAAALGLLLGLISVVIYFAFYRQLSSRQPDAPTSQVTISSDAVALSASPLPSPTISNSPSPEPVVSDQNSQSPNSKISTAHSTTRLNPVSAGPPRTETFSSGKPVIVLTSGGRIEADAAWRTKDGVWYRRNGVVTLIKGNRVKGIVSQ